MFHVHQTIPKQNTETNTSEWREEQAWPKDCREKTNEALVTQTQSRTKSTKRKKWLQSTYTFWFLIFIFIIYMLYNPTTASPTSTPPDPHRNSPHP